MVRYRTPKSAGTQRTMVAALSPKIHLQHLCMLGLQLQTDKYCILPCMPSIIHFLSSCHSLCTKITSHLRAWWFQVSGWWNKLMKRDGYMIFSIVTNVRIDLWSFWYFTYICYHDGWVFFKNGDYSRCCFACWKCHKPSPQSQKTFSLTVRRTCVRPLCHISESVKMAPWLQLNGVESSWSESSREFRRGPLPLRSIVVSRDLLSFNKSVILLRRWEQMHTEEAGETREVGGVGLCGKVWTPVKCVSNPVLEVLLLKWKAEISYWGIIC